MDAAPGPAPDAWELQRQRIAEEGMWPADVVIQRDIDRDRYVASQLLPTGDFVHRDYVHLKTALTKTEKRCLISAWLKDGARLIGYRAHSWRSPRR